MKRSSESLTALERFGAATRGVGLALQRFDRYSYGPSSLRTCSSDELLLLWSELKVA